MSNIFGNAESKYPLPIFTSRKDLKLFQCTAIHHYRADANEDSQLRHWADNILRRYIVN